LSAPPAPSARALDVAASIFLCLSASLRALDTWHRESLTGAVIALDPGSRRVLHPGHLWSRRQHPPFRHVRPAADQGWVTDGCRLGPGREDAPGSVTDGIRDVAGGRLGDATGRQGAHGDRDHQPDPPTPTRLANPARNRDPLGPGHRPQFGQRRLLAGQLRRAWRGHRGRQQRGHLGVPRWGLVREEGHRPAAARQCPRLGPADPDLGWRVDA
jgi:hypothetical protein